MKVPAAILLTMLVATPAMAVDIVSGSGNVIKNGAGLTVVNGDPCAGRMVAACLDREGDRRAGRANDVEAVVEPAADPVDPVDEQKECTSYSCDY